MKALIIEDELPAANRLKNLIAKVAPEISVIAQLDSVEGTINWFERNPMPDLVFLDIHLSDGYSFSIFKKVDITAPIIFTTAYDEYALEAFKVNSVDYLLKPIEAKSLAKSIQKLKGLQSGNLDSLLKDIDQYLKQSKDSKQYRTRFLIKQKDRLLSIEDNQVAYFMASNKLVTLVTFEQRHFIMDETLETYETQLNPFHFFRLNRSILASRKGIKNIYTHYNGKLKIELEPDLKEEIFVSRDKASDFKHWMDS